MDAMDIEAMLIRREAVFSQGQAIGLDGVDMLAAILIPADEVLEASRQRAEQTGPSALAVKLAGKGRKQSHPS